MNNYSSLENSINYNKWFNHYYNDLVYMHNILINNLKSKNIKYKNNITFDYFCEFIYNNSSKRIV